MKRLISFLSVALFAVSGHAQVAQWLIPPVYDKVTMPVGANIIVTDSLNSKTIWTTNGIRLETTTDDMYAYSDGHIVVTLEDQPYITTIYDRNGSSYPIEDYQLGWGYPYFHDGHLLVFDGKYFQYMNGEGEVNQQQFATAYPFSAGFAAIYTYENMRKEKSPYFALIDKDLQPITFQLEGKAVSRDDVEFVSSVNDEGLAVVVIKRKLYYFHADTQELTPLYATADETNPKNQARLDGDMNSSYVNAEDSAMLRAKCGKNGMAIITFDGTTLRPLAITHDGSRHEYRLKEAPQHNLAAKLNRMQGANGKIGLYWDGKEMLPPQFEKVPLCYEDKAIVLVGRKYGLLQMHREDDFSIRLNKGEPIGFRHKRFDTSIRVDMPPYVSAAETVIEVSPETGCRIDKISRQTKETSYGNYTQYECELDIPSGLTEDVTPLTYPAYVVYQGLQSTALTAEGTAWHSKYYNVDINDDDYSIAGGNLSLTFNVSAERLPGETVYPHEARIQAEGLQAEITERVSETRYKCKVYNLREGMNTITVQILEEGCPPANYNFDVNYQKPASHAGPQKVTITKKPRATKPATPVKHLDI